MSSAPRRRRRAPPLACWVVLCSIATTATSQTKEQRAREEEEQQRQKLEQAEQEWEQEMRRPVEDDHRPEPREYLAPDHYKYLLARGRVADHLKLSGKIAAEQGYDDNVLVSSTDEESDFYTLLVAKIQAQFERHGAQAMVNYTGQERLYARLDQFNGPEHFLDFLLAYRTRSFRIEIGEHFRDQIDPTEITLFRDRAERQRNDLAATLGIDLHGLDLEFSASTRRFRVLEETLEFYDHRRHEARALGALGMGDKLQAVSEIGGSRTAFDEEETFNSFEVAWALVGVQGQPAPTLSGSLKVGLYRVDVEVGTSTAIPTEGDVDLMVSGYLKWQRRQQNSFELRLERMPYETSETGWALLSRVTLGYNHWLAERLTGSVWSALEQAEEPDTRAVRRAYVFGLSLKYELGRNFQATLESTYQERLDRFGPFDNFRATAGIGVVF
ncbi:MAG: outer membrane beta-barrel protein [Planctomycetes bacterium]|nr:outer membrane beta-barrel protein [Planctomycetota bacterium]